MYDLPWLGAANDALWAAIAGRLRARGVADVPQRLERARGLQDIWRHPRLLLAQTCGYPLVTELVGQVTLVATPCYAAAGCEGPDHCSLVVVREGSAVERVAELRGARLALNSRDSNTGMNLLRALVAPLAEGGRFFGEVVVTGTHLASLAAVAAGEADVAAIDCVTHALVARHEPGLLAGTRVLTRTASTPGLPLITRGHVPQDELAALREALAEVAADPALTNVRDSLLLAGFAFLPLKAYADVMALEQAAAERGYPVLA
jgi:ABC-type phosphate/phosphonate transport system substrate-binding protein